MTSSPRGRWASLFSGAGSGQSADGEIGQDLSQQVTVWGDMYGVIAGANSHVSQTIIKQAPPLPPVVEAVPVGRVTNVERRAGFVGREAELAVLARELVPGTDAGRRQVVVGLGGMGKSSLAAEFAHRHQADYRLAWKIAAETEHTLTESLKAFVHQLVSSGTAGHDDADLVEWALAWLRAHEGWLLLWDNVNDVAVIAPLLAKLHGVGTHLVTSRLDGDWRSAGVGRPLRLDRLAEDEAVALLLDLASANEDDDDAYFMTGRSVSGGPGEDWASGQAEVTAGAERSVGSGASPDPQTLLAARALCAELGYLPLAVNQVGAYLGQSRLAVADYLHRWRTDQDRVIREVAVTHDHEQTLARVWRITLDKLASDSSPASSDNGASTARDGPVDSAIDNPAGRILRAAAWLASEDISHDVLAEVITDPEDLEHGLGRLAAYSMIRLRARGTRIDVHRAVQAVARTPDDSDPHRTRARVLDGARSAVAGLAAVALSEQTGSELSREQLIAEAHAQIKHADAFVEHARRSSFTCADLATEPAYQLLHLIGEFRAAMGTLATGVSTQEWMVDAAGLLFGPADPRTLTGERSLARAIQDSGDTARAIALMESNLAAWTAVTGPEATSNILKARGSLAGAYAEIGDLRRAVPMYESVLADAERILGPDDPVTSTAVNNVGYAYSLLGDLARAIEYYERGLADRLRVFGPDHLSTLLSRMNLAFAHRSAGHVAEAAAMYKAVIADQIRLFGPDNAMTLSAREGLAQSYAKAADEARVQTLLEEVLTDKARVLGPMHPSTLASRNNLAQSLARSGQTSRALALQRDLANETVGVLGPDHPQSLTARSNLALMRHDLGESEAAIKTLEEVLAARERILGPDHPDTQASLTNVVTVLEAAEGPAGRTIHMRERSLSERARLLGPEHIDTLTAMNNLASALEREGENGRAVTLYEQALEILLRVYGPDHQDTLAVRENLALGYGEDGRLTDAVSAHETAFAEYLRVMGPDDADTVDARLNLAKAYHFAGDATQAVSTFELGLADVLRVHGPDSRLAVAARNNVASANRAAGNTDLALALYTEALAGAERILGPEDSMTASIDEKMTSLREEMSRKNA